MLYPLYFQEHLNRSPLDTRVFDPRCLFRCFLKIEKQNAWISPISYFLTNFISVIYLQNETCT